MNTIHGWAGKILRIDLSDNLTTNISTLDYANRFIGGKGVASRLYL